MATIDDVANMAGVSKSSVSRVLNGNFKYMSNEMRQKIEQAIRQLNYTPNSIAQSLKKKKTQVIGVMLSDISNPFWAEVLKGAQEECMRSGYGIMVSSSGEDPAVEKEHILMLKNRQVDGLIVNTAGHNRDLFMTLREEKFPFVFLDRLPGDITADSVSVNNMMGANQAVQFLVDQGHERIGILLYPIEENSARFQRLVGFKQALTANGIGIDPELIKICKPERGSGIQAIQELMSLAARPTAIFSTHTMLNLEALTGIKNVGFKVPKDVSLIGYDDYPWVPLLDPPLSTVAQPAYELGVQAAALLLQKSNKKNRKKPQMIQLEPTLQIRESCTCLCKPSQEVN